jgi:hypothetical protein
MSGDVAKLTNMPELATMPYDPATFDPVLEQLAGGGADTKIHSQRVLSDGRILNTYSDGRTEVTDHVADRQSWFANNPGVDPYIVRESGDVQMVGPRNGPQSYAGPQGAPPSDPMAVLKGVSQLAQFPGAQLSSGYRDPAHNARVGGVPNSQHTKGTGNDFVVPQPAKAAFMAQARALGLEAIDEGDHIHVELPPGGQMPPQTAPAPAGGGMPAPAGGGGPAPSGAPVAPPAQAGGNPLRRPMPAPAGSAPPSGYRARPDGSLEFIPGGPADPKNKPQAQDKPLPVGALRLQLEAEEALAGAEGVIAELDNIDAQLKNGTLDLGVFSNLANKARNFTGQSNEESRAFDAFTSTLERLRNESLRLNKGVQTEGDAQRAWNELVASINDGKNVQEQIERIQRYNRRAVELQQLKRQKIEQNYQGKEAAPEDDISDLLQLYGDSI